MLEMIESSSPIPCGDDETELHVLTGARDLDNCLWALKSFLTQSGRRMPIVFHSDGTLREDETEWLSRHLPGCEIIDRVRAKEEIAEFLRPYPNLFYFRCTLEQIMFYKLVDFYFYSRTKRVLAIDSDIIWLKEPTQLNRCIDRGMGFFMEGLRNAYAFDVDALRRYYGIRMRSRINAGLIHIPGPDAFNWDLLEYAASLSIKHQTDRKLGRGRWFEQTFFAVLFSVELERYERLDGQQYIIPASEATGDEDYTAVHCVTPKRELFRVFAEKGLQRNAFREMFPAEILVA